MKPEFRGVPMMAAILMIEKYALSHQTAVKFQRQGGKENQRGVI